MDKPRIDLYNVFLWNILRSALLSFMPTFIQYLNSVKQVSLSLLNIINLDILWINSESTAQYTACHLIMETNVEMCLIFCNSRADLYF